jgi:hypothetical protein
VSAGDSGLFAAPGLFTPVVSVAGDSCALIVNTEKRVAPNNISFFMAFEYASFVYL